MSLTRSAIEPPWYGPVCPVVWEGSAGDRRPYPECAEHAQQLEGASPFDNLMEVKS